MTESKPLPDPAGAPSDRAALAAARRYATQHGGLPTVRHLETLAAVSRGTAATVLQELRNQPAQLHLANENTNEKANS